MIKFSLGSKTFLFGEYAVLWGGKSILLCTKPFFEGSFFKGKGDLKKILPQGPLKKYIEKNKAHFKDHDLDFYDPHEGRGGWGRSSAEFLLFFIWKNKLFSEDLIVQKKKELFLSFKEEFENKKGFSPSGGDILCQLLGGVLSFQKDPFEVNKKTWPFPQKSFFIVATGNKTKTHEHLENLEVRSQDDILKSSFKCHESFEKGKEEDFICNLKNFGETLEKEGLLSKKSLEIKKEYESLKGVECVKACGAMGMDTLILLLDRKNEEEIERKLKDKKVFFVKKEDLASGIKGESFS